MARCAQNKPVRIRHPGRVPRHLRRVPFEVWVSVSYALIAAIWIYYSDRALGYIAQNPAQFTAWSIYKGWVYVLVTGLLLFGVLHGAMSRIRQTHRRLEETDAYRRCLLDCSPIAIAIIGLDGSVEYLNEKFNTAFGFTLDDIPPLAGWIARDRPSASPAGDILTTWANESEAASREDRDLASIEGRVTRKDGAVRNIVLHAAAIDGKLLVIFSDITEQKQAKAALAVESRRKDEFLAMLSHELRNPLAPIRNAVEVMRLARQNEAVLVRQEAIIERQIKHITRLLDDLLDVARITRGVVNFQPAPLDLREVIEQAIETTMIQTGPRQADFTALLTERPLPVHGDAARLVQVIGNLLTNAMKYSDGGQPIRLTAALEPGANDGQSEAVVRIADHGIGIAPDLLPHVFELFVQADKSLDRTRGGLGIGLSLTRQIVELHGGRIEAGSAGLGQGSLFTLRLPALPDEDRTVRGNGSISHPEHPAHTAKPPPGAN